MMIQWRQLQPLHKFYVRIRMGKTILVWQIMRTEHRDINLRSTSTESKLTVTRVAECLHHRVRDSVGKGVVGKGWCQQPPHLPHAIYIITRE